MTSTVDIRKIFIKSETDSNKQYEMYYMIWKNENTPKEIICSCLGYQYRGKCKHIEKYDPENSNLWKSAKSVN